MGGSSSALLEGSVDSNFEEGFNFCNSVYGCKLGTGVPIICIYIIIFLCSF
jgi:hypothetical protein